MLTKMAALRFLLLAAMMVSAIQPSKTQALSLISALAEERLSNTNFSCIGKVIGGYYADVYAGCQMFHVCTLDEKGEIHDYTFDCLLGTVFDQETRVCERADEVDCSISESFFHLNDELYGPGIIPPTAVYRVSDEATGGTDFPTTTQTAFVFPETSFLCNDKVPGGLYADIETGCVVFHICSVGPDSSITDNKFICGVGTLFDQKSRTCQVASAVDCSRSESLFYLNDRLRGPENVVDLCLSHPLGTPLADLTSGCQNYVVCESLSDKRIVERHRACKKDSLFSQMRKRCLPSKKVDCNKETISGILGMDSSKREKGKKRVTRSLLLHRLRRAALPPLVNVVTNAGMEDARVRRALYSLAVLQRWALENARDTTFIEVYTLNTKEVDYPKKAYAESPQLTRYGYIHRKKRDVAEQALLSNQTKTEETFLESSSVISSDQEMEEPQEELQGTIISPTSTIPVTLPTPVTHPTTATLITTTVTPKTRKTTSAVPRQTVLPKISSVSPSTSFSPSPTKISATLSTVTISNTGPRIIKTVTLPAATVTVTNTVTVGLPTTENPIVNTAVPTLPMTSEEVSAPLPITSSTITGVDLVRNISRTTAEPIHSAFNVSEKMSENSTPSTQSLSTSATTIQNSTPALALTTESSSALNASSSPQDEITEKSVLVTPTPSSAEEKKVTSPDSTLVSSSPSLPGNLTSSPSLPGNLTSSPSLSGNLTSSPSLPGNLTSTPATTTLQVETAVTEASAGNASVTVSTNITTTTTASITKVIPPLGSVDTSTTVLPSDLNITNNASTEAVTQAPTPTIGPFTRENLPETNFTCKDKKLEQFYPDTEANCQVFHYCSPGFEDTQILDLKFLCTGATMFDVNTQKCENLSSVTCGHPSTPPTARLPEETAVIEASTGNASVTVSTNITTTTTEVTPPPETPPPETPPPGTTAPVTISTPNSTTTVNLTTTGSPEPDVITASMKIEDWETTTNPNHITLSLLEGNDSIAVTSTVEPEVDTVEIDVTERIPREEIPTSTSNISETYTTTEFVLEDESLITTELGPFIQQPSKLFEMLNEDKKSDEPLEDKSEPTTDLPVQASTTISVPLFSLTTVPVPLQISNSSSPPLPALNNTNISSSVMNISSTEVSENTNIETPL